jgi:alkanesulfonate monooxygenase SsuD/methylene tetrahydromethanopterin reductase-like flavin-dependent oxidoreductase (luciferase family)
MRFGVLFELQMRKPWGPGQEQRTYLDALEQARAAERAGFEYAWAVEHHFLTEFSHCSAPEVFLAAVAQQTSTIRIGHGIVLLPAGFNHPFRVAERVAALDILSGGRVEFGSGRSVTEQELGGFGVAPADSRPMWEEAVRAIPQMWMHETFPGARGRHFDLPERPVWPKPLQQPHPPMWMAATNPESFELAGRLGLGLLCFVVGDPDRLGPLVQRYREAIRSAEPVGGFVNEQVAAFVLAHCDEDRRRARLDGGAAAMWYVNQAVRFYAGASQHQGYEAYRHIVAGIQDSFDELVRRHRTPVDALAELGVICVGDPDDCVRAARRFEAQGIDQLITLHQIADLPAERVLRSIGHFGESVIPALAGAARA